MSIKRTVMTGKKQITLICLLIFFCGNVGAQVNTFRPAVIVQHNSTQIECLAKYPAMSNSKVIIYKIDNNSKTQKMKSDDIKMVRYFHKGDKTVEKEFLPYISFFDMSKGRQNHFDPLWMDVLVRGRTTLYVTEEIIKSSRGQRQSTTYHYYCKRENEEFASKIAYVSYRNSFLVNRIEVGEYFADASEISEKIENKIEGYSAKDIISIVEEYNEKKQRK